MLETIFHPLHLFHLSQGDGGLEVILADIGLEAGRTVLQQSTRKRLLSHAEARGKEFRITHKMGRNPNIGHRFWTSVKFIQWCTDPSFTEDTQRIANESKDVSKIFFGLFFDRLDLLKYKNGLPRQVNVHNSCDSRHAHTQSKYNLPSTALSKCKNVWMSACYLSITRNLED